MSTAMGSVRIVRVEANHLQLLRRMHVLWAPFEAGVPYVWVDEPYGSANIVRDVKSILEESENLSADDAVTIHREAMRRLPIMISAGTLPPGSYNGVSVAPAQIALLRSLRADIDTDPEQTLPFNCKRPYGDMTAFERDMAHILGINAANGRLSEQQEKSLARLHRSLEGVLKAWLSHAAFSSGDYRHNPDGTWVAHASTPDELVVRELTRKPKPEALLAAVASKDLVQAKRLLERSSDTKAEDANGYTPMLHAVKNHDLAAVKLLLAAGESASAPCGKARVTPLMLAAATGSSDVFDFLVNNGADLSPLSASGTSVLGFAVLYGQAAMVAKIEALGWSEAGNLGIKGYHGEGLKEAWRRLGVDSGVVVANVLLRSTADRLGLLVDDRILETDGKTISNLDDIRGAMKAKCYGEEIVVAVSRKNERIELRAKTGPKIGEAFFKFQVGR